MTELFSLGEIFPSDFLEPGQEPNCQPVELKMMLDGDLIRLEKTAPLDCMYGRYFYRSGITDTMKNELRDIVESILKITKLKENDLWIDVASNDGTLLSFVPKHLIRVGIDPADDSYKKEAQKHANLIIQDYFSANVFKQSKFGKLRAKVVTSIAVFYDLERPEDFIRDIGEVLDDNGLWALQLSYTPLMLTQLAFDNIVHEHLYYYSLFNLKAMLERNGFKIVDCQLNDVNGGSFRVYAQKKDAVFCSQPYRDVCDFRIKMLLEYEKQLRLSDPEIWRDFYQRILELKEKTVGFIKAEKAKGKTVMGYGASTKSATLLQFFGLDNTLIDAIAERSVFKWGLKTVGTNIPIISEEEMRAAKPDYLLILPWHFLSEFLTRENDYLQNGGKFIVPCPKFEIISKSSK